MISITVRAAIGAAATITNNLTGQAVEYIGPASTLSLYGSADILGMTHSLAGFQGTSGGVFVPAGSSVPVSSTVGAIKTNESFLGMFAIPAQTRLVHSIVNPGAASNVAMLYVVG